MQENITETIGVDIGDKESSICILCADGSITRPKPVKTTPKAMGAFFALRKKAHVVIEVGTHSPWMDELLRDLGHTVTVANARNVQLISKSSSKTDKKDAELLARLGKADRELLSPIQHRGKKPQADLAVPRARDALVKSRTKLINTCRGVVKSFGLRLPSCSTEIFHRRVRESIPEFLQPALFPILDALSKVQEAIQCEEQEIERLAKKYPDMELISQVSGVGTLTALVFYLILEDKHRFQKSRTVGAYIGLRPKKRQSGKIDPQLHITKTGDSLLRRLLVQSAHYILGPFGPDTDLRRWGLKLSERGGKNAKKRACVAVARKLSVLMHRLWVTGEEYVPVGYGKTAKAA